MQDKKVRILLPLFPLSSCIHILEFARPPFLLSLLPIHPSTSSLHAYDQTREYRNRIAIPLQPASLAMAREREIETNKPSSPNPPPLFKTKVKAIRKLANFSSRLCHSLSLHMRKGFNPKLSLSPVAACRDMRLFGCPILRSSGNARN